MVTGALDDLFARLRFDLDEVLDELRTAVDRLGPLDVADSESVAAATDDQRSALLAFGDLRQRYNRLRMAQTQALEASDVTPPGTTGLTVFHGWPQVFERGVHEFAEVRKYGNPSKDVKPADRLRVLARRPDVWLPTVADLRAAWDRLTPNRGGRPRRHTWRRAQPDERPVPLRAGLRRSPAYVRAGPWADAAPRARRLRPR